MCRQVPFGSADPWSARVPLDPLWRTLQSWKGATRTSPADLGVRPTDLVLTVNRTRLGRPRLAHAAALFNRDRECHLLMVPHHDHGERALRPNRMQRRRDLARTRHFGFIQLITISPAFRPA